MTGGSIIACTALWSKIADDCFYPVRVFLTEVKIMNSHTYHTPYCNHPALKDIKVKQFLYRPGRTRRIPGG